MRALFLSASGLSADSGLPTFRGAGGLYENLAAGTQGNVLPIDEIARSFPGRTILNNLHQSDAISADVFTHTAFVPATEAIAEILDLLDEWRESSGSMSPRRYPHRLDVDKRLIELDARSHAQHTKFLRRH